MKKTLSKSYVLLLVIVWGASIAVLGCDEECEEGVCYPAYGYYYDSLVSGLAYGTPTQTGTTGEGDDPGRFQYLFDETISFSLGDTALGEALASERMTPFDLAGVTEEAVGGCQVDGPLPEDEFRIVHNLAVLLQTFDTDGDPTEGIEISDGVAALFEGVSINVDQAWEDFQSDTDLLGVLDAANSASLFPDTRVLREREEALRALYQGIGLCPSES
jgi:hypothetical protein